MARSEPAANAIEEISRQARAILAANPLIGPQVRQFRDAQDRILNEAEAFTRHWLERRHEAAKTAIEATKRLTATGPADPATAVKALAEWQKRPL